jgi:hypothetical protein
MDRVEKKTPESSAKPILPVGSFISTIKKKLTTHPLPKSAVMEMPRMMPAIYCKTVSQLLL